MKILGLFFFDKGIILILFSGLALKTENFVKKKLRVDYVCIYESFDTIFNIGYGSGKSPMDERVNKPFISFSIHLKI